MSSNYMRILGVPDPFKTYGYQKVDSGELRRITDRVMRHTYTTEQHLTIAGRMRPPRCPSPPCRKAPPYDAYDLGNNPLNKLRSLPPKKIDRMVRRLRTPTISRLAAEGALASDYEMQFRPQSANLQSRSAEEDKKVLRRLQRPTTATKTRTFCTYCDDPDMDEYMNWDFSDDKVASKDELDAIIHRVRTPTVASQKGEGQRCKKRRESIREGQSPNLPLVSGLSRTKRVDDIVDRLYRPTSSIPICRRTPMSTPTSSCHGDK